MKERGIGGSGQQVIDVLIRGGDLLALCVSQHQLNK